MLPLFLSASLFLAFFALLTLVRFDNTVLWKLTIISTEAGHWLAGAGLVICFAGISYGLPGVLPSFVALIASWVLLRPTRKAIEISRTLPERMERAFGTLHGQRRRVFSILSLFLPSFSYGRHVPLSVPTPDGRDLRIDLYPSKDGASSPLVVVIHGGGWNNGDPDQLSGLNHIVCRKGYSVASISYGLAPRHHWPTQRNDVLRCIAHLREIADNIGIDPHRIVLLGRSAGGQLATQIAYTDSDSGICGVIAMYAPHDLEFAYRHAPPDDLIHSRRLLEDYMGAGYGAQPSRYRDASAIFHVRPDVPPTLLLHGTHDLLTWYLQSFRLSRTLERTGAKGLYVELSWATHGFDFFLNGPAGQLTRYSILTFLDTVTHTAGNRSRT